MENVISIQKPYAIYLGDARDAKFAKTGLGVIEWRREFCVGQVRSPDCGIDGGLPDLPIEALSAAGVKSLILGVASIGGDLPQAWQADLANAAQQGVDIVSGGHIRLADLPGVREVSQKSGARLIDVRTPPANLPIGKGEKRGGKRLLTVGTDCAVGKKYTALAIARGLEERGANADFRASGQTGIIIAGRGVPIDAVISDFLSGAAEILSPDNDADHWDVIEGQGSLFHPGYAAVSLGLLHGSQPDAIVVCHEAGRRHIHGWPDYKVPDIDVCIQRNLELGGMTNPKIKCVGISVNTSALLENQRTKYLDEMSQRFGLPCVDPIFSGAAAICDRLDADF